MDPVVYRLHVGPSRSPRCSGHRWVRDTCRSSLRAEPALLPAEEEHCSASVEASAAAAASLCRSSAAAARPEEAVREGPEASGRLSGQIRVLVQLHVSNPREEREWSGLKRPRCPSCRRTDPDWFLRINPTACVSRRPAEAAC